MPTGDVEITILDGGAGIVVVPQAQVAVVIGASSTGTAAQVVASRNANTLSAIAGIGPAVDQAAMIIAAGGTALFMKAATTTPGAASAVIATLKVGTSTITVTGNPFDAYLVKMLVTFGGTIGTAGIRIKISLDAGRTYGPEIAIGTATTYAMVNTGLTLAFGAGTLITGDIITFGCTEPLAAVASVQACLVALEASPYSIQGWGSMRIVGPRSGADATSIQGYLDTMTVTKTFTRAQIETRDASLPVAYGGTAETDATYSAAVALDYAAASCKRVLASAGHYNMQSQFPVPCAGTPRLRRSLAYALACRQVNIRPQTHAGRVSDGGLAQIIIDSANDSADGFVYHDDYQAPVFDVARLTSARKRKGKGGYFIVNPRLLSPSGSVFTLLPLGNVIDIGCSLVYQTGTDNINSDVLLNANGTIDETAAQSIERVANGVLRDNMLAKSMISGFTYAIDRTVNVRTTQVVAFACTLASRGYILEIDGTIGLAS